MGTTEKAQIRIELSRCTACLPFTLVREKKHLFPSGQRRTQVSHQERQAEFLPVRPYFHFPASPQPRQSEILSQIGEEALVLRK